MRHLIILSYAWLLELYRKPLMLSNATIKLLYIPGFNRIRTFNAKARAYAEFTKAKSRVPAYSRFLKANSFSKPSFSGITPNIHEIPSIDKENYVKKYSIDDRCSDGKVPTTGVIIDESSGSSGTATNWVRGQKERKRNFKMIKFGMRSLMGQAPLFVINAFALGPWATGMNISMSCVSFSKLKSLGPDKIKIENTIKEFGKDHKYVILGYPPFLKLLVDNSAIHWNEYDISFIFGGESMTEGMRDYLLLKGIKKVYSSFGASDLELNISTENDFTISLRKLLRSNASLRQKVLKHTGALPMVFQFNPTDFLIESSEKGELIITICRPGYLAPKIRYNIHDRGHVMQLKDLESLLMELKIDTTGITKPFTDLPILFHYGRADMTVSFFGSNISPTDIQEALYNLPALVAEINSFCLNVVEDKDENLQLVVSFEMQRDKNQPAINLKETQTNFFEELAKTNQDFREAKRMAANDDLTVIRFYTFGQGPFADFDCRIKAKYIS
jgi:phenylacetate-CoA ligase